MWEGDEAIKKFCRGPCVRIRVCRRRGSQRGLRFVPGTGAKCRRQSRGETCPGARLPAGVSPLPKTVPPALVGAASPPGWQRWEEEGGRGATAAGVGAGAEFPRCDEAGRCARSRGARRGRAAGHCWPFQSRRVPVCSRRAPPGTRSWGCGVSGVRRGGRGRGREGGARRE